MRRQRNMAQMKKQNKTPEKELNETEITNLPDAVFKTMLVGMLKELTEYSKNIREEMKVSLSEIKKNLQGINSEEDEAENQINDLEHKEEKKHSIRTAIRKKNPKRMRMG